MVVHVLTGGLRVHRSRRSGEEPKVVDREIEFEIDNRDRLADVLALDGFEFLDVVFQTIGQRQQRFRPSPRRSRAPLSKCGTRCSHCGVDVGCGAGGNGGDNRSRGRRHDLICCTALGGNPLPANEIEMSHVYSSSDFRHRIVGHQGPNRKGCPRAEPQNPLFINSQSLNSCGEPEFA